MAKQIKVIKCPQCGSTKPELIRTDHYRCDKCGTEFFLDSDDININVNHNHNVPRYQPTNVHPGKGLWIGIAIGVIVGCTFLVKLCTSVINNGTKAITYKTYETKAERSKFLFSMLVPVRGEGVVLYLEKRGSKDSIYAVYRNLITPEIVAEQNIGQRIDRSKKIEHRFFASDNTHYIIVNQSRIYKVDPDKHLLTDVTNAICSRKPALEAGLMSVQFVPDGTGEGFRMNTNLGKELFYFPAADVLCTEQAYKFMCTDNNKGVLPGAENKVYYLFLNKESSHSSNVAQLMEITYLFNNGGPENKLQKITGSAIRNADQHRISFYKPITDELVCFSPEILYYDNRNILISSRPTIAPDAVVNVQLLDTSGKIIWTTAFSSDFSCMHVVRTSRGFMLQISENNFWEISNDGKKAENYNF